MKSNINVTSPEPRYVQVSQIARAVGMAPQSVERRLDLAAIAPDGLLEAGSRSFPLFLSSRIPQLRHALGLHTGPETILSTN